jgi:hypothetical protein
MKRITILLILTALVFTGCTTGQIRFTTEERFDPVPEGDDMALFLGEIQRPHRVFAKIDSRVSDKNDEANKKVQIEDIKRLARKIGADAVQNVRLLNKEARGMVPDRRVPFPAWKQGRYELYFLRGDAIKYGMAPPVPTEEADEDSSEEKTDDGTTMDSDEKQEDTPEEQSG